MRAVSPTVFAWVGIALLSSAAQAATGSVSFNAPHSFQIASRPIAMAMGDFNGDGKPDVVALTDGGVLEILLGNGRGDFRHLTGIPLKGVAPNAVVAADFNGDGKLDLAVASWQTADTVTILLGDGTGKFTKSATYSTGRYAYAIVAADFNRDGKMDLGVMNGAGQAGVSILLGHGDGTFQAPLTYSVSTNESSGGLAAGDFNGDGYPDLIVITGNPTGFAILLGNGDGTLQQPAPVVTDLNVKAVAVADFNGDGKLDVALANPDEARGAGGYTIVLGNGDGTFQTPLFHNTGANYEDFIATADFNGDGKPDLVWAAEGPIGGTSISMALGNGDGSFQAPRNYLAGANLFSLAVGDVNGDGTPDLVAGGGPPGIIGVLLGTGKGGFEQTSQVAAGTGPTAVATGDFNGDGKADLAVANFGSNDVSILSGNGDGTFQPQVRFPVGKAPIALAVGDFNGDGHPDLAVANAGSNGVSILLGNGDGTFQPQVMYAVGSAQVSIAAGDVNGDGKLDLVVAGGAARAITILMGNGDGTFQKHRYIPAGGNPWQVLLADLNGDGKLDIVAGVSLRARGKEWGFSVILGQGDGVFSVPKFYDVTVAASNPALAVADLHGSGKPDIIMHSGRAMNLFPAEGSGLFGKGMALPKAPGGALAVADFGGTGRPDIAVAGNGAVTLLLGKQKLPGPQNANFIVGDSGSYESVAAADFNGDGKPDLAVPNYSGNTVSVLLNTSR